MSARRLYFDNAATSFPKPQAVHDAMMHYGTEVGGTAGRGNYREALEGGRIIRQCRQRLARLFHAEGPDRITFTLNATDALNLAIKGTVSNRRRARPGRRMHIITTAVDHNSVLRPLNAIASADVDVTMLEVDDATGRVSPDSVRAALRTETVLVAMVHASNVTGVMQPIAEVGEVCRESGVTLLVDAAQSAGHVPIDVQAMKIDLMAFPGHKGLLGPLGTGGLYIRPGLEEHLDTLREGGTGSQSEQDVQPDTLPDKFEPGSQNAIGIAGLSAAVQWILDRGEAHWAHERTLIEAMVDGLSAITGGDDNATGLQLLGPRTAQDRVGVFSLTHETMAPHELAMILESEHGILARAGLHCAPHAHRWLGTRESGGAVRLSLGPFLSTEDVAYVCRATREIALEARACSPAVAAPEQRQFSAQAGAE